jgi:ribosomal subunit interface protein
MEIPLELAFHNVDPSPKLEQRIRERVDKLHRFFDRIVSCRVTVSVPHRSQANALTYHVRVEVRVPGKELVVSRDPGDQRGHFDPYVVVRDAFDAMQRQLESHSRKVRGEVKTPAAPLQGRVVRTFADHGFIATTDGREVYFHRNSVVGTDFGKLGKGEPVELVIASDDESPIGAQATTVKHIRPMQLDPDPPA